jgi:hypothetical protein
MVTAGGGSASDGGGGGGERGREEEHGGDRRVPRSVQLVGTYPGCRECDLRVVILHGTPPLGSLTPYPVPCTREAAEVGFWHDTLPLVCGADVSRWSRCLQGPTSE